ncbi:hypothetical protein ARMSODRAFT_543026 [Armillaria solidipes]|uniref:Uncharacterized protein n=1 Tax=Armillaria solidipes TaxID=1076256 RepID=A0A2H3BAP9_9AGAR|nr:hypothetical protein ARMSODRAFT_543026 [Armillaria solidipes]
MLLIPWLTLHRRTLMVRFMVHMVGILTLYVVTSDQRKNPSCRNALIDERNKSSRGIFDWVKVDEDISPGSSRFGGSVTKWQGM